MNYSMTLTSQNLIRLAENMAKQARQINQQFGVRPGMNILFGWRGGGG